MDKDINVTLDDGSEEQNILARKWLNKLIRPKSDVVSYDEYHVTSCLYQEDRILFAIMSTSYKPFEKSKWPTLYYINPKDIENDFDIIGDWNPIISEHILTFDNERIIDGEVYFNVAALNLNNLTEKYLPPIRRNEDTDRAGYKIGTQIYVVMFLDNGEMKNYAFNIIDALSFSTDELKRMAKTFSDWIIGGYYHHMTVNEYINNLLQCENPEKEN